MSWQFAWFAAESGLGNYRRTNKVSAAATEANQCSGKQLCDLTLVLLTDSAETSPAHHQAAVEFSLKLQDNVN
jgi:hypothetical protein